MKKTSIFILILFLSSMVVAGDEWGFNYENSQCEALDEDVNQTQIIQTFDSESQCERFKGNCHSFNAPLDNCPDVGVFSIIIYTILSMIPLL